MDTISVNKFRENLKSFVEQVITQHLPIKVTRRAGEDFVVISAEDWEREQETLYVLQNNNLMLRNDPSAGIGKPESLKHKLTGLWSRRISQKDRVIYKFDELYVYVFAIGGHYDQF